MNEYDLSDAITETVAGALNKIKLVYKQSFSRKINCTKVKCTAAKLHKSPDETDRAWLDSESPSNERFPVRAKTGLQGYSNSDFDSTPLISTVWYQVLFVFILMLLFIFTKSHVGPGHPSSSLSIYFLIFSPFYFSLSFIGFTYFLLLSIPSLSTRIAPLRFQAGGRRRRPNLGLVCVLLCNLCNLYSLVKMDCGVLFYLV